MTRPLITIIVFFSLHLLVLTVAAQMPTSVGCPGCYELKTHIEANYFSHDEASVRYLLAQSRDLVDQHPAAWHPHYYAGLINVQLGNIVRHDDKDMAYRHYTDALAHMLVAHERSPTAEITIVLADVYGKLASLKTFKMLYYGSRSKSHLIDAFRMDEHSPKACLVAGIEMMWTPIIFGGSTKRARRFLEKALTAAPDWREPDRLIVRWATRAEIFAHLAQLEILCKRPSQARHYATQALSLVPDYGFVLRDVLPQLNQRNCQLLFSIRGDDGLRAAPPMLNIQSEACGVSGCIDGHSVNGTLDFRSSLISIGDIGNPGGRILRTQAVEINPTAQLHTAVSQK